MAAKTHYYALFHRALGELYHDGILRLKTDEKPDFRHEVFDEAARQVYERGEFTPDMLREDAARALAEETDRLMRSAISYSITEETPPELTAALRNNAFIFSGFKTAHTLSEVGLSLTNDDGSTKPFNDFLRDVRAVDDKYNGNYLYAEYNHAVHSSQMAVKWRDFERDGDDYDLQYRTAGDERVREAHRRLDGVTLPPSDKFWERYLPPNGWNCRCNVVQVRTGKYERSDSDAATAIGDEYTAAPKAQMFRFNAGKELKLFPDKHPYFKASRQVKTVVEQLAAEIRTPQEAVDFINASEDRRAWFERGFNSLISTTRKDVNGYTDMRGLIAMTQERLDNVLAGLTKLRQGKEISFAEADALATFWHEITHNRSKPGNMRMTALQTRHMELANEFVARKTLPEFYKGVGGKMQHHEFMDDRESTGYNRWVRNYCKAIELTGADAEGVLAAVREHLFNQPYAEQEAGLVNALMQSGAHKADGTKLKKMEVKRIVKGCLMYSENMLQKYVEAIR